MASSDMPEIIMLHNYIPSVSNIYESIKANINTIMSDPSINELLNPSHNTVTQKCLMDNEDEDTAYSMSYLVTLLLVMDLHGLIFD
jgi:hypothetical protein